MAEKQKDVGFIHDFVFYLQNAIAEEHHALESYSSTKEVVFLEIAERVRKNRSKWMYKLVPESKAQIYCMTKHLAAMAMASKEMGNRFLTTGQRELAMECFDESQDYEAMIILINEQKGGKNDI